jgi:hypothetical protein
MRKAIFLHLLKTAGTSVVNTARHYFGNENVSGHGDIWKDDAEQFQSKAFISSHFGFNYAKPFLGKRHSFIFLRDPSDRLISFYNFCRGWKSENRMAVLAKAVPIEDFFALGLRRQTASEGLEGILIRECLWNHQAWQLAHGWGEDVFKLDRCTILDFSENQIVALAEKHLHMLDRVGFVHSFESDANEVFGEMGFETPIPPVHANATEGGLKREGLSARALDLIKQLTQLDQTIFDHATRKRL